MAKRDPRDAGHGGKLEPDPPEIDARFYALGQGTVLRVVQLIVTSDGPASPTSFLVKAEDGGFWVLQSRDPILDGIAYVGSQVPNL